MIPPYHHGQLEYTRPIAECAPIGYAAQAREYKCDGCGQRKPESSLEVWHFVGGLCIRICKGTNCGKHWKMANGK